MVPTMRLGRGFEPSWAPCILTEAHDKVYVVRHVLVCQYQSCHHVEVVEKCDVAPSVALGDADEHALVRGQVRSTSVRLGIDPCCSYFQISLDVLRARGVGFEWQRRW
eukprot:4658933-Prymnesium_polylepis.1